MTLKSGDNDNGIDNIQEANDFGLYTATPLEDGDLLHWVDAESKFMPSKIHILAAADYISPATPEDGSALIWSDANAGFIAADPLAGFSSSINDLSDVNTASVSPENGQALVWSDLNSRWQPGEVIGTELDELSDVGITAPENAQVLRYDGNGWVNAVQDYSDIANPPVIPSTMAEMADVDVSLAPAPGQALVWNGTDWAPADQSGGSGGNTLGAWTERADSTATTGSISNNTPAEIEFTGLGEAGQFVQVAVSQPAWIVFYATDADRIADATRNAATDPLPGSGVLLEVITENPGDVVLVTPGAIYYNNDGTPDDRLYGKVVNQSGSAADISVTVRAYTQKNEGSPIVPLSDLQAAASTATTFSEFQTLIAAL
ncbi:MAG: hypothetical protein GY918_13145 [Gammaproteobacteria bacterium]|nr:hypothetical protein [Gammaproteobacteria bacterium]